MIAHNSLALRVGVKRGIGFLGINTVPYCTDIVYSVAPRVDSRGLD